MRRYAVVLAMLVTVGYGYAAHVAVSAELPGGAERRADTSGWAGRIWYGGTLDPITVEAYTDPVPRRLGTKADPRTAAACLLPGDADSRSWQKGEALPARARSARTVVKVR